MLFDKFLYKHTTDCIVNEIMENLSPKTIMRRDNAATTRAALHRALDVAIDQAIERTKNGFGVIITNVKFMSGGIHEVLIDYKETVKVK